MMKKSAKSRVLAGTFMVGSLLAGSTLNMNGSNALSFNHLGNGAEVRSHLSSSSTSFPGGGDQNCGAKTDSTNTEMKSTEAKCGEGKCGEATKKKTTTNDSKTKDAKCGEGKCGN